MTLRQLAQLRGAATRLTSLESSRVGLTLDRLCQGVGGLVDLDPAEKEGAADKAAMVRTAQSRLAR